MMHNI